MSPTTAAPKLKTSAMIASFADPDQRTTAAPFGHALVRAAEADDRIVGLSADLAKYTDMHVFAQAMPERFFQMGMAEQLLLGAAAGLAEAGLVPFASTYSVFAARRAYDFLCLDAAEPGLNVNIVGGLPGLTTGYGPSHQATEDVAIFRGMPGLTIVDPCDSVDIEQAVPQLAASPGPTYLRLLRGKVPTVLDEYDYRFQLGKAAVLRPGADVVFVSSGLMTMRALQAAERLAEHQVDVAVVHAPTLKPFDEATDSASPPITVWFSSVTTSRSVRATRRIASRSSGLIVGTCSTATSTWSASSRAAACNARIVIRPVEMNTTSRPVRSSAAFPSWNR